MIRARAASARGTRAAWAWATPPNWWVSSGGSRQTTPPGGRAQALNRAARPARRACSTRGNSVSSHSQKSRAGSTRRSQPGATAAAWAAGASAVAPTAVWRVDVLGGVGLTGPRGLPGTPTPGPGRPGPGRGGPTTGPGAGNGPGPRSLDGGEFLAEPAGPPAGST